MVAVESSGSLSTSSGLAGAEFLHLDDYTLRDLEIFASDSEPVCLFQLCNLTHTDGGAKVLQRRMQQPWSSVSRIRSTQQSLSFILAHQQAFSKLPSAYASNRVEHYSHEVLPIVANENLLEFAFGAFFLWVNHDRHYTDIVRGVQITCSLIRALRLFVNQVELSSPKGELAALIEEMQALLGQSKLNLVPDHEVGSRAWRILRLDQIFRLHEKLTIARILQLIYEVDALVAMANATAKHNFVLPDVSEGPLIVQAEGLVHPLLADAVANPVQLDQEHRVLFLTGPNMAGKTTYLRAFATALYLGHLGMGVPASRFVFSPAQHLFSSISLSDNLRGGVSYFRAEALRVKAVAQAVAQGHRVVAIMDEPFKGTNVKDSFDASLAIMQRFATRQDCLFMFSSHLIELSEQLSQSGQIDCRYFEAQEGEGRLRFDYLLHRGVSSQRLGMRVLREEGVFDLLDTQVGELRPL